MRRISCTRKCLRFTLSLTKHLEREWTDLEIVSPENDDEEKVGRVDVDIYDDEKSNIIHTGVPFSAFPRGSSRDLFEKMRQVHIFTVEKQKKKKVKKKQKKKQTNITTDNGHSSADLKYSLDVSKFTTPRSQFSKL
jgi:hypothetical protein